MSYRSKTSTTTRWSAHCDDGRASGDAGEVSQRQRDPQADRDDGALLERKVEAILCIEAGGLNSTIPFIAAAQMGIPIVDADAMGRAFPELQMVTLTLGGMGATPMAMVDDKGNGATFDTISNQWTEKLARALTIEMGGSAMVSLYPILAGPSRPYLIEGSLSTALDMGRILDEHKSGAAHALADTYGGRVLFTGRVRDVERRSDAGFTKGKLVLEGQLDFDGKGMDLSFQNEFLAGWVEGDLVATTPDLITLLDANKWASDHRHGQVRPVRTSRLPCDPIWRRIGRSGRSPHFGMMDYQPLIITRQKY